MLSDVPTCDEMRDRLSMVADGDQPFSPRESLHVETCLRCQAERAQYRRLMKAMNSLRDHPTPIEANLEYEILGYIDAHGDRLARRAGGRAAATIGGIAAGAAAAAGVIALATRHRRVARLAS